MEKKLRSDELGRKGYRILQDPDAFCFGVDAVLLADFAKANRTERVLELGTGNGVIPLLLDARDKGREIVGLELQEEAAELARKNFALNGAEDRLSVICGDLKAASQLLGKACFDVVVTNAREVFGLTARNRINKGFPGHTPLFLCPEIRAVRHRMAA